jgi:hypothetical protein
MPALGNSIPKWSARACIGLNLGPSPMHARNVNLILNLHTGLVSVQYCCHFDNFFETTHHNSPKVSDNITWQQMANLVECTKYYNKLLCQSCTVRIQVCHNPIWSFLWIQTSLSHREVCTKLWKKLTTSIGMFTATQAKNCKSQNLCFLREILQIFLSPPVQVGGPVEK